MALCTFAVVFQAFILLTYIIWSFLRILRIFLKWTYVELFREHQTETSVQITLYFACYSGQNDTLKCAKKKRLKCESRYFDNFFFHPSFFSTAMENQETPSID